MVCAATAPAGAPAADTVSDEGTGGTIVVTARNRAEKIQDVPLTVTAVTGDQIIKQNIHDLKDISFKTPGLIINGGGAESLTRPSIRGLPSNGGDPTVAVFFDGGYIYNIAANNVAMIDMDRVEVVKGPVNSLYGRAAYAGAINYISKLPTDKFEGRILGSIGNDGQRKIQGVVNIPIIADKLMVRAAASYDGYDGGWKDSVNGLKQGGYKKRDFRFSALWKVSDKVTMNGRIYYGNDRFAMSPIAYQEPNCGTAVTSFSPFQHLSYTCGEFKSVGFQVLPESQQSGVSGNDRKVWNGFWKMNVDTGFGDLTALTTVTSVRQQRFQDFVGRRDGLPFGLVSTANATLLGAAPIVGTINLPVFFGSQENTDDIAQELRFQSKQNKPVRLTAGAYVAHMKDYQASIAGIDGSSIPAGYTITGNSTTCSYYLCDRVFLTNGVGISNAATISQLTSTVFSGFAGLEADPVRGLTLSADGRYTSDKRTLDTIQSNSYFTANANDLGGASFTYRPLGAPVSHTFNYFSGRASARYKITSDYTVYASVANGVKVGGFNATAKHSDELSYGNEKNMTYEVGLKTSLLDHKMTFNLSAFLIKIKGIQASGPSAHADTAALITTNVGGATSKGFEIDSDYQPLKWLSFSAGVGFADATYDQGTYDYSFASTCALIGAAYCNQSRIVQASTPQGTKTVYSLGGLQTQGSSKWTASFGADVNVPVTAKWAFFAGAKYRFQSRQYTGTQNISWWGPLHRVDVRAGVERGNLRLSGSIDNLTQNRTPDGVALSSNINDLNYIYQYAALPYLRRFALTAEYKF